MSSPVRAGLLRLRKDFHHGSSWYYAQGISLLARAVPHEIPAVISQLRSVRPGMAPLENLSAVVEAAQHSGRDIGQTLERLEAQRRRAQERVLGVMGRRTFGKVLTLSYSSAVLGAARSGAIEEVHLLESQPGTESRAAFRDYSRFVPVTMVPDAIGGSLLGAVDTLLVGCDGIFAAGGVVNKSGSLGLARAAAAEHVPVRVVGESYKFSRTLPQLTQSRNLKIWGQRVKVPLLEAVPLRYVASITTDVGTLRKPDPASVLRHHREYWDSVFPRNIQKAVNQLRNP